jgi:hypothetical protein
VAHEQLAGGLLVKAVEGELAADALARSDRGDEADSIEAVIDRHFKAVGGHHDVGGHAAEQRERQEAVGDGAAERGPGGGGRIDMDELLILGRVGERLDAQLVDGDPFGGSDVGADFCADLVEGGDGHGLS